MAPRPVPKSKNVFNFMKRHATQKARARQAGTIQNMETGASFWSAVTCHPFRQATCRRRMGRCIGPTASRRGAALLIRQVESAPKEVTSHRTPKYRLELGP